MVPGNLSDHFDPRDRSLGLSQAVAEQPTVAAMAIAAHEVVMPSSTPRAAR